MKVDLARLAALTKEGIENTFRTKEPLAHVALATVTSIPSNTVKDLLAGNFRPDRIQARTLAFVLKIPLNDVFKACGYYVTRNDRLMMAARNQSKIRPIA